VKQLHKQSPGRRELNFHSCTAVASQLKLCSDFEAELIKGNSSPSLHAELALCVADVPLVASHSDLQPCCRRGESVKPVLQLSKIA